jgi:hypothetical protein
MVDRFEGAPDGTVRWTVELTASGPDPFRAVIGTTADMGDAAAESYWIPRAFSGGGGGSSPSPPFPQPSLINCTSARENFENVPTTDTLWILNGTERAVSGYFCFSLPFFITTVFIIALLIFVFLIFLACFENSACACCHTRVRAQH